MQRVDSLERTLMLWGIGGKRKGDDRRWDGWIASPTWWPCVWVNSGSWWWTGRPDVLLFTWSQGIGQDWVTELNWTILWSLISSIKFLGSQPIHFFFFFFFLCFKYMYIWLKYSWSTMFQVARWFNYTNTHILFLKLFSIIGYYKILTIVPCALQ